jgi:hypothetical protein
MKRFLRDGWDLMLALSVVAIVTFAFCLGTAAHAQEAATEAQVATAFVEVKNNPVRMQGVHNNALASVVDTSSGRGVVHQVEDIDPAVLQCHYVLEAPARPKFTEFDGDRKYHTRTPVMPQLEEYFGDNSWPVEMPDSCTPGPDGLCFWSATFKGQACIDVAESNWYAGSTIQELMALPPPQRVRLLTTMGTCEGEPCTVPYMHIDAIDGARVWVNHSWAGRADYNFVGTADGTHEQRFKTPEAKAEVIK